MLRELTTDLEMLERFAQPSGKDVVDIGCGGGALVRELGWGARVTGVEISESQLANAAARDPDGDARYLMAGPSSCRSTTPQATSRCSCGRCTTFRFRS